MSNTDLKTVAEYISDTFNPATHLHYYETAEEADGKEDDLYEFFNDMQDTLGDYLDSRKKFRTELTGNSRRFISVNYNGEIKSEENSRTCMAALHTLITKFGFSGSGFSEELIERVNALIRMANAEEASDFIFVNIHGLCNYELYNWNNGRKVAPKSLRLYTIQKSEESGCVYRVVYTGSEKLSVIKQPVDKYILIDVETGKISEIDALCTKITSDIFVTTESVNNGTAFKNCYRSTCCNDLLDCVKDLSAKKCRECEKIFAMTDREINWYAIKGLKVPVRCKECRIKHKSERNKVK